MKMSTRRRSALSYAGSLSNLTKQCYAKAYWLHLAYDAPAPSENLYDETQCSLLDREKIRNDLLAIKGTNEPKRKRGAK
jgi:hypothetical protein